MDPGQVQQSGLASGMWRWWRTSLSNGRFFSVLRRFISALWQFVVESAPSRRRQRYGDVDYDWDHRVDTTGAAVSWRERLLGALHSPYQPTDPALFHEMLDSLKIDFHEFTFIDLGSGKGRTLLMASDYPFHQIMGVELLESLHQIAVENINKYRSDSQKCFRLQSVFADATEFVFPAKPTVLYLFNPLPESGLSKVITNLERSLHDAPRPVYLLYHNPEHETALLRFPLFEKSVGTSQYSVFASNISKAPQ